MRAPDFWQRGQGGINALALAPLGWAYGLAGKLRRTLTDEWHAPIPVLCIGNVVAGGAGKTPVAIDIGQRLLARGITLNFLSRGYGGTEAGPHRVNGEIDNAANVGDEPMLLSRIAPTWIARDRVAGAQAIARNGGNVIVMDDGFQNPALAKTCSVLVVDGRYGFGNGRVTPAGPLRESVPDALARADAIVLIGPDDSDVADQVAALSPNLPLMRAKIVPGDEIEKLSGKKVSAFAAIARPEKFFQTLEDGGCKIVERHGFADHHVFTRQEITTLKERSRDAGLRLVTTEKDLTRIAPDQRDDIETLTITLHWEDEAALSTLFDRLL